MDALAIVYLAARVVQSSVHVAFPLTNLAVSVRFTFFAIGLVCVSAMGVLVVTA